MAKFDTSFNFGANKPKKSRTKKGKKSSTKKASGTSNAWTAYVGKK